MNRHIEIARRVVQSRAGGAVERCHGIPHLRSYSNARHSWGVAMLMYYLWPKDFPRLAAACLGHDVPEAWVGDVPAPTCRYVPGLKDELGVLEGKINISLGLPDEHALSDEDLAKLKACDRLDFWIWCREEESVGNQFVTEARIEVERFFTEVPLPQEADALFRELKNRPRGVVPIQAAVIKDLMA